MLANIIDWIKQPWPWYISGPLIGLMVPVLLLWDNKQFGISSTFRDFCAFVLPSKRIAYLNYNLKEHTWRNLYILGVFLGGVFCASFLSNSEAIGISSNTIHDLRTMGIQDFSSLAPGEIFNWKVILSLKGFIFIVVGGFFVGFGTRYADGCTSGHAITGMSLLSLGSLISVVGFFIGGMITTYFLLPLIMKL